MDIHHPSEDLKDWNFLLIEVFKNRRTGDERTQFWFLFVKYFFLWKSKSMDFHNMEYPFMYTHNMHFRFQEVNIMQKIVWKPQRGWYFLMDGSKLCDVQF